MDTTTIDTAVIGAGCAGLDAAKRLTERGIRVLLIDEHARIGDSWRERYRSLRLFTPRRYSGLPGLRMPVGRFDYPTGEQLADYLEAYAAHFSLPVRTSTRVVALERAADGPASSFRLSLADGGEVRAQRVVVAAGAHRIPVRPAFAADLDPAVRQLHSIEYRGPEQFADGPVLVVGAGNSGTDVALDAARAGHRVTLAGRHPGHVPVDIDTVPGNILSTIPITRMRRTTLDTPRGRAALEQVLAHGVPVVRNGPARLERAGVVRVGRIAGVERGRPVLEDGTVVEARTVVWCTGSRPDLSWIRIEGVLDEHGRVLGWRGIPDACPGLAFMGTEFQYSMVSASLMGMDADARYLAAVFAGSAAPARRPASRTAA